MIGAIFTQGLGFGGPLVTLGFMAGAAVEPPAPTPTPTVSGGGTSRVIRRGKLPKKYSDFDFEAFYRRHRNEPEELVAVTQGIAEALADPSFPEVTRAALADTLLPFMERQVIDWIAVVQDRQAMQKLIQMQEDADDDELLLLTVH